MSTWKRLSILPPLLLGIGLLAFAIANRTGPEPRPIEERVVPVRVVTLQPVDFVPRARGWGLVQPRTTWEAVARVRGPVIAVHPDLRRGRLLEAGTEVLRIDPADYDLALAQAEAAREGIEARLDERVVDEENIGATIAIERRALAIAEAQLERQRSLLARGTVSESVVDQAEQTWLAARQRLVEQENRERLLPAQRRLLLAERAQAEARIDQARLDLERTVLELPFDARIDHVAIEEGEYVNVGQVLARAEAIDAVEIEARMPLGPMRHLIPREIAFASLAEMPATAIDALPRAFGLEAEVRLAIDGEVTVWPAEIDGATFAIDPQTRTAGLVARVVDPYRQAEPGMRPPLFKDAFVEVVLRAPARAGTLAVPREAARRLPDGRQVVHVAGEDDRLVTREVEIGARQDDVLVVLHGLAAGERVVVSDLAYAIEGLRLAPAEDESLARRLRDQAEGGAP